MSVGTIPLSEAELRLLQSLVYRESGMHFDERRTSFLEERVQRRLRECRLESFYSYYRLLISIEGRTELDRLLENLAVNETSFFRNKSQLDFFHDYLRGELLPRKRAARDFTIRLWSAGCSTGQEPYTLAMLVADAAGYESARSAAAMKPDGTKTMMGMWRVEILASDISYSVLRAAQEGVYSQSQMESVDYTYRLRYFDKVGDRYAVRKALKEMVHFDLHNLKTEYLPQGHDAIFCRNVMMYFDEAEQKRLVDKFYRCLNPRGYLFVGHAESLLGLTPRFAMTHRNGGTAYRRIEGAA
jgi:chemotaxis protein methyltransferase CheR